MEEGRTCLALVAGLPASYIKDVLFLDEDEAMVISHIIRRDGSFVIRSGEAFKDNYFDRIRAVFEGLDEEAADQHLRTIRISWSSDRKGAICTASRSRIRNGIW